MSAFIYGLFLQWKQDLRNKEIMLTYYLVPLVFFGFMGGIFTSINPTAKETLVQSMTVFGITMGAILGTPTQLVSLYGSEIKKSYIVGKVPLWTGAVNNCLSALCHLFIMSMIILLIAPLAFNATLPKNIFIYIFNLLVFIMTTLVIGSALGLFVKSNSKLTMVSQLIFLPSVMLSGVMFPKELLPDILREVGKVLPATWGFQNICANKLNLSNLLPLILIFTFAIFLILYKLKRINGE